MKLRTRSNRSRLAFLRELTGMEEMLASRPEAGAATELLARLLVAAPAAAIGPDEVWSMSVADRDRLIAELYLHYFGDSIETRLQCGSCRRAFGLGFSLRALLDGIYQDADAARVELPISGPHPDGSYDVGKTRFRLPTTADERELAGLEPEERAEQLFRRCLLDGAAEGADLDRQRELLERALGAEAPVITLPVPVSCVHCGAEQETEFDIVRYFMASLDRERPLLTREVHTLARAYRWSFEEIVRLPRAQRHAHVSLVEAERGALEAGA